MSLDRAEIKKDIIAKAVALMGSSYDKDEHESLISSVAEAVANSLEERIAADQFHLTYESKTSGASPITVSLDVFKTTLTTGDTQGNETVNVGNGSTAVIGQRKLVFLGTRTHASDEAVLDHENMAQGSDTLVSVILDEANEFVLLEWRGAKWEIIKAASGVVTTS